MDGNCITQRCLHLPQDLRHPGRGFFQEDSDILLSLVTVARSTYQCQAAYAVRAAVGAHAGSSEVFYLQRDIGRVVKDAVALKFLLQIHAHFIAGERTLPITDATDVGYQQQLHVETHQFLG